jgi:hypothetical protein
VDFRFVTMIEERTRTLVGERAKVVSGVTVSTPQADIESEARHRGRPVPGKPRKIAAPKAFRIIAARFRYSPELQKWPR